MHIKLGVHLIFSPRSHRSQSLRLQMLRPDLVTRSPVPFNVAVTCICAVDGPVLTPKIRVAMPVPPLGKLPGGGGWARYDMGATKSREEARFGSENQDRHPCTCTPSYRGKTRIFRTIRAAAAGQGAPGRATVGNLRPCGPAAPSCASLCIRQCIRLQTAACVGLWSWISGCV
jgi:hypothetical protein